MRIVDFERSQFTIRFKEEQDFRGLLDAVKEIPGRRFRPTENDKHWTAPTKSAAEVASYAKRFNYEVSPRAEQAIHTFATQPAVVELPHREPDFEHLPVKPYAHQVSGVRFLLEKRRAILSDDMGLGKTLVALVAASCYDAPIHVVCPASLQENWRREAAQVNVKLRGVHSWAKVPQSIPTPFTLIADECHYAQAGRGSQRGRAFLSLAEFAQAVYMVSGTPIKNGRPINLLPLLQVAKHPLAQNVRHYHVHFCNARATPWTRWDTSGARHLDELHEKTKDVILRRLKKDCLDLPPKLRVKRDVESTAEADRRYANTLKELQDRYHERLAKGEIMSGGEALVMMNHLRHSSSMAKIDTAIELAEEAIEEQGSVVVFAQFVEPARSIARALGTEAFTGDVDLRKRQVLLDEFQAGKTRAFVGTIGAGGLGITLTKAQTVIMVDRPWTPGDTVQAEDRLHRISQLNQVLSVWLQYDDVDRAVDTVIEAKADRIELVLQGKRRTLRTTGQTAEQIAKQVLERVVIGSQELMAEVV